MTAPVVSEARNVMIATTATSARPAIEVRGTIGASLRAAGPPRRVGAISSVIAQSAHGATSIVDVQPAVVQHEAAGVELVHQRDDRGSR